MYNSFFKAHKHQKNLSKLAVFLLCAVFFSAKANSAIIVKGNQRIDAQTIVSFLSKKNNPSSKNISRAQIDRALKKLFESNLFVDAKIYKEKNDVIIEIKENPIVAEVKLVGNKKIEDDVLTNELLLKKRGVYTKFKLQSDLKRINEIYLKSGRFLTKIDPKVIQKDQNRIEVIFDIKEGPRAKISDILFVGNDAFSDADLIDEITTKTSKWYKPFSSSDVYFLQ